jgi:hypothetical protein
MAEMVQRTNFGFGAILPDNTGSPRRVEIAQTYFGQRGLLPLALIVDSPT